MGMKAQKCPKNIEKGNILYRVNAYTFDDGKSKVDIEKWVVRSIRKVWGSQTWHGRKQIRAELNTQQFVHISKKLEGVTQIKGQWEKYYPTHLKKKFRKGEDLLNGFYTTPLKALMFALSDKEADLTDYKKWDSEEENWKEEIASTVKELRLLKSRITKFKNGKKKKV